MSLRKELLLVLGIVLFGWVLLVAVLAKWQQGRAGRSVVAEPVFLHYPGTESVEEQTSPNLGFRKYWFLLKEEYPSESVSRWYQQQLESEGWRLVGARDRRWFRQRDKDRAYDTYQATWVDPRNLFQLDLEMVSTVEFVGHEGGTESEEREPGIKVYVTMRRSLIPGFVLPPTETKPPRSEIEVR